MKNIYSLLLISLFAFLAIQTSAQTTLIPDNNFLQALVDLGYGDGVEGNYIPTANISGIVSLDVSSKSISDLTGIEDFVALTKLVCIKNQLSILDLSANTALTSLNCSENKLTSLNVSANTGITYFNCYNNQLTTLDISSNTAITYLDCRVNELTSLNLSANTSISKMLCSVNQFSNFDVSAITALKYLDCTKNQLTSLDVRNGNNANFTTLDVTSNSNLTCLYVDDKTASYLSNWRKDATTRFVNDEADCAGNTNIPDNNFEQALIDLGYDTGDLDGFVPTANISGISALDVSNKNISNLIGIEDFTALGILRCNNNQLSTLDVSVNTTLILLDCSNNQLTSLDVSANTALTNLSFSDNQLTSLSTSANKVLAYLNGSSNQLTSLDLSANTVLAYLNCGSNQLASLDVSANTALTNLHCFRNHLPSLDLSANTALIYLDCYENELSSLDVSTNTSLVSLNCNTNQLTSIDVSTNTALADLNCFANQLTSLDLSANTTLVNLYCKDNQLSSLYVRNGNNVNIASFWAIDNPNLGCIYVDDKAASYLSGWLTDASARFVIDETDCAAFTYIPDDNFLQALTDLGYGDGVEGNLVPKANISGITALDVSNKSISDLTGIEDFAALTELKCNNNQFVSIDVSANTALILLDCSNNQLTSLDVSANTALTNLNCSDNQLPSLDLSVNTVLVELNCSVNQVTNLDVSENTALANFKCIGNQLLSLDVRNGNNVNITSFSAESNPDLRCIYVDDKEASYLSGWTKDETASFINDESECALFTHIPDNNFLQALVDLGHGEGVADNNIPTANISGITLLDVSGKSIGDLTGIEDFVSLAELSCYSNQLTSLDISSNTALTYLDCSNNQLTSLNVSANTALTNLSFSDNQLTSLSTSANTVLAYLNGSSNQLTSLDVSANTVLVYLNCSSNQLASLDLSANTTLAELWCENNQLINLDVRNGNNANTTTFNATSNPNLICIYVDDKTATYLSSGWTKDVTARFVNNESDCAAYTYIPDNNFLQALIDLGYDEGVEGNFVPTANVSGIISLDVSAKNISNLTGIESFTALAELNCADNQLTSLNLSANTVLTILHCENNRLKSLDVRNGNNIDITTFDATGNPGLTCIYVDDKTASYLTGWEKNETASFANNETECIPITHIPDNNFLQALVALGYGEGVEGNYIPTNNISGIASLDVSSKSISDLTGIEDFVALTKLVCINNRLLSLDLSANTVLTSLNCSENKLVSLNISANTGITYFNCYNNQLTTLDISANTAITYLDCRVNRLTNLNLSSNTALVKMLCSVNQFSSFDVSAITALKYLDCNQNQLTSLDVRNGSNASITTLDARSNPNLTCVYVDDKTASYLFGWRKDATARFVNNEADCAAFTYIPDNNFLQTLIDLGYGEGVDRNYVPTSNINEITSLDVSAKNISNLTGIEGFAALTELNCASNQLGSLDLSANTALATLHCINNRLKSLDIRNGNNTNISTFDATGNPSLTCIYVDDNTASYLTTWGKDETASFANNESECVPLTHIPDNNFLQALINLGYGEGVEGNYIPTNNISGIASLDVSSKSISDLTGIEDFVALKQLRCNYNRLTSLDVSANTALTRVYCYYNQLTSLDVSANTALTYLDCDNNQLTSLDVSANTALTSLRCAYNQLTSLDVSANTALNNLYCNQNQLTNFDVRNGENSRIYNFRAQGNPNLRCIYIDDKSAAYLSDWEKDATAYFVNNETECSTLTYVPDNNFEQALIDLGYDTGDLDGFVPTANISGITTLDVSNKSISDLTGIEDFTALGILRCNNNQLTTLDVSANMALALLDCSINQLTSLGVSANTALTNLSCSGNQLTNLNILTNTVLAHLDCGSNQLANLDVSVNTALAYLNCGSNLLGSLNVSANTALTNLYCHSNQLSSLNVAANTSLVALNCNANQLTSLDVSTNTALADLNCDANRLTGLDVSANTALADLNCDANQLTGLDVSANTALVNLYCKDNQLSSLDVRNGNNANITSFMAINNPDLGCIYVDDKAASYISGWLKDETALFVNNEADCASYTFIPDDNFLQALIDLGYGEGVEGNFVPTVNINGITSLDVSGKDISDLTGLEDFGSLTQLICINNQLTSLDVSANTALTYLSCINNKLSSIDVSANVALTSFNCSDNQLTSLGVTSNTNLVELNCSVNQLTSIDVSANTVLVHLNCVSNQLLSLDVRNGNNANITTFDASGNPDLTCLYVDDKTASYLSGWIKDETASFVNNESECGLFTHIPDNNFLQALIDLGYGSGVVDNNIPTANIRGIESLDVSSKNISDLTGIEDFVSLTKLVCVNNQLSTLDLSANTVLTQLLCYINQLTSLDVSKNTALTKLDCDNNRLTSLDVSANTALIYLYCYGNQLTNLDVSTNTVLTYLDCRVNQLSSFDLTANTALIKLYCSVNQLSGLDLSANTALTYLDCNQNQLASLDVRNGNNANVSTFRAEGNPDLTCIYVDDKTANYLPGWTKDARVHFVNNEAECTAYTYVPDNNFLQALIDLGYGAGVDGNFIPTANISGIESLDVSSKSIRDLTGLEDFVSLTKLVCVNNQLSTLDLSANTALTSLNCSENKLTSLNISENTGLTYFNCYKNQLPMLDVSTNAAITYLDCRVNELTSFNISANTALIKFLCSVNQLLSLDLSANTALTYLDCNQNPLASLDLRNGRNANITTLNATSNPNLTCVYVDDKTASYLSGWRKDATAYFVNDEAECNAFIYTHVPDNNFEQALINLGYDTGDIDGYVLTANISGITSLDVSSKNISDLTGIEDFVALTKLVCTKNQLSILDLSANTALTWLNCSENKLTSLNISENTGLTYFNCYKNQLPMLDVSTNTALTYLDCRVNQLSSFDLKANTALVKLLCSVNQLLSLDLSANPALTYLDCNQNQLSTLDVRNGNNASITTLDARSNPNLTCFYVDDKTASYLSNWTKDETAYFVNNETECGLFTYIPDNNFLQALVNLGYGEGVNGNYIPTVNINRIDSLNVSSRNISDLTGIEDFVSLTYLNCYKNQLTTLDLSSNMALEVLYCGTNQLSSLDVSRNTALSFLNCYNSQLSNLDLSANTALIYLDCRVNQLPILDLSSNLDLTELYCNDNQLTSLDIRNGNNANISAFNASSNSNLTCIYVDDNTASYLADWTKDETSHFVNNEAECTALSVNSIEEQGITMYPNPTSGIIKFDFSGQKVKRVIISDVRGKTVLVKTNVKQTDEVDLSGFANGLYIVTLQTDKGNISSKIIKE